MDIPRRPNVLSDEMAFSVALKMADRLIESCGFTFDQREDTARDLIKCSRSYMDGYALAKELDTRCGWDCDLMLADELDGFPHFISNELRLVQIEWQAQHNIQPQYKVGQRVRIKSNETGVIDRLDEYYPASYLIKIDNDPRAEAPSNARRVVEFEMVISLEPSDA